MARKKAEVIDANQPWISNYPPLKEWLDKIEARCVTQIPAGDGPFKSYVEVWQAPRSTPFVIIVRSMRHGWDIFTPCHSNEIKATLDDAEARIFSHEVMKTIK